MEYPSIRGEDLLDYAKKSTRNILHAYIYARSQSLNNECPGYISQAISRLEHKCANMNFSYKSSYNILFQKGTQK